MSNHSAAVRAETMQFGEEIRQISLGHIAPAIEAFAHEKAITPPGVMMVLNYIGSLLGLESALGISGLHPEIRGFVDWCVDRLEP